MAVKLCVLSTAALPADQNDRLLEDDDGGSGPGVASLARSKDKDDDENGGEGTGYGKEGCRIPKTEERNEWTRCLTKQETRDPESCEASSAVLPGRQRASLPHNEICSSPSSKSAGDCWRTERTSSGREGGRPKNARHEERDFRKETKKESIVGAPIQIQGTSRRIQWRHNTSPG